jgi:urocanate hydratase
MNQELPTILKAPRGPTLSCEGWSQEAALRLFLNSKDPEVSDNSPKPYPHQPYPNAQSDEALRSPDDIQSIVTALRQLPGDETLFVQEGGATRRYRSAEKHAPAVLVALSSGQAGNRCGNSQGDLYRASRISAASWFYVGNQGTLQAEYEILGAAAQHYFNGTLAGKLIVACGLGAVGGAQLLAATLHGAAALGIEPDAARIKQRVKSGYCEIMVNDLDEALRILKNSVRRHEPASVALVGETDKFIPELASRGIVPDLLFPNFRERFAGADALSLPGMVELKSLGSILLDGEIVDGDTLSANFADPSVPVTCIALSGSAADIARTDRLLLETFHANEQLQRWLPLAKKHVRFQGLPARVVWLTGAERLRFALASNELVARAELQAPVVIAHVEPQLSRAPGATVNQPMPPAAAWSEAQMESFVKAAPAKAPAAFLIAIDSSNFGEPLASAVIADGTLPSNALPAC